MQGNTGLTELRLANNGIGDAGVQALAEGLQGNTGLTTLNLSNNYFLDAGVQALAEGLQGNTGLTELRIASTGIGEAGVQALAKLLQGMKGLTSLDFLGNDIGEEGSQAFLKDLDVNTTLLHVSLSYSTFSDAIFRKVQSNRELAALTQMAQANPPVVLNGDVPAEVVGLIEQATIVADHKTGGADRTLEQKQASLNELRLALALRSVTGE